MMVQLQYPVSTTFPCPVSYSLILFKVEGKRIQLIKCITPTKRKFKTILNCLGKIEINFVCKLGTVKLKLMFNTHEQLQISVTSIISSNVSKIYTCLFELNNKDDILCIDASDGKIDVTGKKVTMVFDLGVLYIWIKKGILYMVYDESSIPPNEFANLKNEVNNSFS